MSISHRGVSEKDRVVGSAENSKIELNSDATKTRPTSDRRRSLLELALITLAVLLFCAPILDLGQPTHLPGNEAEVFQILDWTLVNSLRLHGSFPIWNPNLGAGQPYIADPMLHTFNPVSTLPVLLLGVRDGFKVGIALSFILAALGMWWFGAILGLSRPARIWVALMYAFAGQPVARFFQGQYLFILGFTWIPWATGNLLCLFKTGRRVYWAGTIISLALLFFSGNVYIAFYMLVFIGLIVVVYMVQLQRQRPFVRVDRKLAMALITTGALTLGVIAIQLIPLSEFWPRLSKSQDVVGSHSLRQIYLDYTSKDTFRPDAFSVLPARQDYYAYIGIIPISALLLLPIALWKRERKPILVLSLMLLFVVLWVNLEHMPWYEPFLRIKLLMQFSNLLRVLVFGSFATLLLAALGIDTLWKMLEAQISTNPTGGWEKGRALAANLGLVLLGGIMLVSAGDLYQTHRKYIETQPFDQAVYTAARWLRQHDLSDYYVRFNPTNSAHEAVISADLRFINAWYHFGDIRQFDNKLNTRPLQANANYVIQGSTDPPPASPTAKLVQQIEGFNIFRLPDSLPYIFSVADTLLAPENNPAPLHSSEVTTQTSFSPGPNRVEVIASASENETLVVMTTHYPGWKLEVDGHSHDLLNVGGYLGTKLLPGVHKYVFYFRPRTFTIGLIVSLLCASVTLYLLIIDSLPTLRQGFSQLRSTPERLRNLGHRVRRKTYAGRMVEQAIYKKGKLELEKPLELDENAPIRLELETLVPQSSPSKAAWRRWKWASADLVGTLLKAITLTGLLFAGSLMVYAVTRFYALERFPIYFFGDEAVQVNYAENLIARGFHGPDGALMPLFVEVSGNRWAPLISVYFHALTLTLFGKSIMVTRATSAAISLLGAGAVGLILHKVFKARYAWAGVLLVAVTPAWFLHSRTAFETVLTTSFYALFLLFYLLYYTESPRYLYAAVIFGAATFYSYSNAQLIILAAATLLFISDVRYHLRNREVVLRGLLLATVLAIPLIEFRLSHPQAIHEHLRVIGSYWTQAIPLQNKLLMFSQKYLYGLSPQYWFLPNSQDLPRHRMAGFGQMQTLVFPLVLLGLAVCIAKWRSSPHRAVILAALATPVGAALLDIGVPRVLAFIIPANLLAAIGLEWIVAHWKERLPYRPIAVILFLGLSWANFAMLRTALTQGPLWFQDYGLYGMQYGARQVFEEAIPEYLAKDPEAQILVSSTWANGAENFLQFFITPQELHRVRMDGIDTYLFRKLPLDDRMIFVMTALEYQKASQSPKFNMVTAEKIIPYPDGSPGFYFTRLRYADNVDAIFAAEQEARRQLVTGPVSLDGKLVELRYSQIDMGEPSLIFDNDPFTLMRGLEVNPFILEFIFPQPRHVGGVTADLGLINSTLTAKLYTDLDAEPATFASVFPSANNGDPNIEMPLPDAPERVSKVRIEILDVASGERANIHIRELHLLP